MSDCLFLLTHRKVCLMIVIIIVLARIPHNSMFFVKIIRLFATLIHKK